MNDMKAVFEALNNELAKEKINMSIICVGGYALERYDLRATQDIDFSMLLEGFSNAYGMDWLEEFFKNNQEKISSYY